MPLLFKIYHTIGGFVNETTDGFTFGTGFSNCGVLHRGVWIAAPAFPIASSTGAMAAPALSHQCPVPSPGGRELGFSSEA